MCFDCCCPLEGNAHMLARGIDRKPTDEEAAAPPDKRPWTEYDANGDRQAKPDFKARMAVKLAVAGAFHTDFMAPAVSKLEEVLSEVEVSKPRIPVISNVDAKTHSDPEVIKQILTKQVTAPVQWETIMNGLIDGGFEKGYELGPGKVLSGIMKRISKTAVIENVEV